MKSKVIYRLAFAVVAAVVFFPSLPLRASETDAGIAPAFKNTYVYKTYLKDDAINIEAKEGVVTLTGTAADELHKALARETVASLPGVTSVDNQLVTQAQMVNKAEVAAENADTWIGRKVVLSLMFHRDVNAGKTAVEVKDGIVALKGEAASMAQKELTSEYAKDIEGVKEVKNEMTVAATPAVAEQTMGEQVDDASITAQVKMALLTHRSTSAISTKVETRAGEVTLTGIARNEAEKSLVTKLVTDIKGVTSVKNEMTVGPATTM